MNSLAAVVAKLVLNRLVVRACPATVSRSGNEGKSVNCFITKVDIGEEIPMVVLSVEGDELCGLAWGGEKYSEERRVNVRSLRFSAFEVTHFYGLAEIRFSGLSDVLMSRLTAWPYFQIHVMRTLSRVDQFFFNKKKLVTKKQMDLLRFLIQRHLDGKTEFSSMGLMSDLYSMRWVEHPDADSAEHQLEFYLDSMVDTGELTRSGHRYQVTGRALKAIEEYEEQERKHTDNVKLGRRMFWLTAIIAALTAVQAGLIRLPAFLDFAE